MSASYVPDFAMITVAAYGMRLELKYDRKRWRLMGWKRKHGSRELVLFTRSEPCAPSIEDAEEVEGGPGIWHGGVFLKLPEASLQQLRVFVASIQGKLKLADAVKAGAA